MGKERYKEVEEGRKTRGRIVGKGRVEGFAWGRFTGLVCIMVSHIDLV